MVELVSDLTADSVAFGAALSGAQKQLRRPLCYRNSVAETFLLRAARVFPLFKLYFFRCSTSSFL